MNLSSDFGKTWNRTNVGPVKIAVFTFIDTEIWVGTTSGGIIRSTDYGTHWITTNGKLGYSVFSFAAMGNNVFVGTSGGIFKTTNSGSEWISCGQIATPHALTVVDTNLFAATDDGVFRSSDQGSSWVAANSGIVGSSSLVIAVSGSNIFATQQYRMGLNLNHSMDNGSSWSMMNGGQLVTNTITAIDSFLFDASDDYLYVRNVNNGSNWSQASNGLPRTNYQAYLPIPVSQLAVFGKVIFAGVDGKEFGYRYGLFRSTDYGHNWTEASINALVNGLFGQDTLIFATVSGQLLRSDDYGLHWTLISSTVPFPSAFIALGVSGNSVLVSTKSGLFRSTDEGASWILSNNGLADSAITRFISSGQNILAESSQAIYYSSDGGANWFPAVAGLIKSFKRGSIAKNENYLFVGTDGLGVWKRPLSDFSSPSNSNSSLDSLSVFPNPISISAKINFKTLGQGTTTIKIFNSIGREVSSVLQGVLEPGAHSIDWIKPEGLPNGAYMCEVSMGGQTQHSLLIVVQ